MALNSWGAQKAYGDENGNRISTTYLKISDIDSYNFSTDSLKHSLTFGANGEFVFDGSQDVTVPVYTGTVI